MKKLFLSFIAICLASMCSLTAWATERVAPTIPAITAPESGLTYYLYNVERALFLSSYSSIGESPLSVLVTQNDEGAFLFKNGSSSNFIGKSGNGNMATWNSATDTDNYWSITESEGMYTIQCSPLNTSYYAEGQYLGTVDGSTTLKYNRTAEEQIHWLFILADDTGKHFVAEMKLYRALCALEGFALPESLTSNFEALYADRANQTTQVLTSTATSVRNCTGMSQGYQAPWWNERPILFYTADGNFGQSESYTWALPNNSNTSGTYFHRHIPNGESHSISATVLVTEPSTLVYSLSGDNGGGVIVYVDDIKVRTLIDWQYSGYPSNKTYTRSFEELEPGLHTITWTINCWTDNYDFYLHNVGVMSKPQITVSLLEPGSLGTEVLYNTDHIKNVRRLKVKGAMNTDDWARIKMMSTLLELDLSEAHFTEVPAQQFRINYMDTTMVFLHKVSLPEGLIKINKEAFYCSFVEEVNFPSTLQSIGQEAFYMSHIREIDMPDNLTEMGIEVFKYAYWLTKAILPKDMKTIPDETFNMCYYLNNVVLPEKLETVNYYAFHECHSMNPVLPEGLKTVGTRAFEGCRNFKYKLPEGLKTISEAAFNNSTTIDSLIVPSSVTSIGQYAFCNSTNLKYAELSVEQYTTPKGIFDNTPKLEVLKLNSATVVSPTISGGVYPHRDITQLTLKVPHYLVNSYKLHEYWYNAKAIEPFDYSDITYIPLHGNLTLNHERFGGQPSIEISSGYYLKINGENEQKFNNIKVNVSGYNSNKGQLLNNCENITATGDNYVSYGVEPKKWYFISLPFDLDVSRINPGNGVQYAIRYYDGAGRAANGKSGNWKNVDRTSIIPAGTGFIFQTNNSSWTWFYAADTENKYGTLRTTEFNKTLDVNASETTSNKGWNLVGNPYQCYYNNHCLNFTAPITVWSPDNKTYTAYSLTDDDYAIRPNEAFFVQCPNEEYTTIGFPLQGRQLTSVIESQNAVKAWASEAKSRQVVNLTVSNGEMEDMTRVVLNEEASMAYEVSCDASKFMSMDGSVPQIYTLDAEGTWYAINERPVDDGIVALGFYAGTEGSYTISVTRCDAERVFLTDNLTGETVDITGTAYTFSAKAGTDNTRFTLSFIYNDPTAIVEIDNGQQTTDNSQTVYDLNGRQIVNGKLSQGIYIIRQGKKASKVIVR